MNLNVNVTPDARNTYSLITEVQRMARDPGRSYSDSDVTDTLLSGLVDIVANLEIAAAQLNRNAADAKRKADLDDLQYRSAGGR